MDGAVPLIAVLLLCAIPLGFFGLIYSSVQAFRKGRSRPALVRGHFCAVVLLIIFLPLLFLSMVGSNTAIGPAPSLIFLLATVWSIVLIARLGSLKKAASEI